MVIVNILNGILRKFGAEIVRFPNNELKRRNASLKSNQINLVLDVGANNGKYGVELRKLGYNGRIISFEPLINTFKELSLKANVDGNWVAVNVALGNFDGESEINIAGNVDSSSILDMLPAHTRSAPESKYIGKQKIKIKKLDTIYDEYCSRNDNVYLKLDTQGFEKQILEGSENSLQMIKMLQLEMSIIPLYQNSFIYKDIFKLLEFSGFELYGIEPGFYDVDSGKLLQFDGIFLKK